MKRPRRRVLLTAYHFPPLGGGGVLRVLKLARYLSATGWIPEVLCADDPAYQPRDPAKLAEVDCPIFRVPARRPPSLARLLGLRRDVTGKRAPDEPKSGDARRGLYQRLVALGALPDLYRPWIRSASSTAAALIHQRGYDLLWTTAPPFSTLLVGLRLKRLFGVPWVADLRDSWTPGPFFAPPTALHQALHRRWESRVLRTADAVVVATPGMAELYRRAYPDLDHRLRVITNGYDEADFADLPNPPASRSDHFRIGYAGSFYGPRRPDAFLQALAAVAERRDDAPRFVQIGSAGGETEAALAAFARAHPELIERSGALSHSRTLAELAACDLLLLVIGRQPGASSILTGKLFEYLRLGKPILACCPPGDAAELIGSLGAGVVAPPDDPVEIARALEYLLDQPPPPVPRERILPYERSRLAAQTARLFDEVVEERG